MAVGRVGALKNHLVRFNMLRWIAKIILPSYRFEWLSMDWWNDQLSNFPMNI
jgi:hypothetical protein